MLSVGVKIEYAGRRAMGDEEVQFVGDAVPNDLFPVEWILEGVPYEVRRVRRTEYPHAFDLHHFMLQVNAALFELVDQLFSAELHSERSTGQGYLARYCSLR